MNCEGGKKAGRLLQNRKVYQQSVVAPERPEETFPKLRLRTPPLSCQLGLRFCASRSCISDQKTTVTMVSQS